jgi:hypothetical protein
MLRHRLPPFLLLLGLLVPLSVEAKKDFLADPRTGKVRDIRPVAKGNYTFEITEPKQEKTKVERFFPFLDVSGVALEEERKSYALDIMFALDKSGSVTQMEGGFVTEPDGFLGLEQGTPLNIYQAQIKACLAFIKRLANSETFKGNDLVRVGLVTFSGPNPSDKNLTLIDVPFGTTYRPQYDELVPWMLRDSRVALPLTSKLMDARVAFEAQFFDIPDSTSGTDFSAGVMRSLLELEGANRLITAGVDGEMSARSVRRRESKKVIMFLTDMTPSLPGGHASKGFKVSGWASDLAADVAGLVGVQIHAFSWGRIKLAFQRKSPKFALTNLAIKSGGLFTQVEEPGELVSKLANVSMSGLYAVEIVNKAALQKKDYRKAEVELAPDGSFAARIPMVEGTLNEVVVTAQIANGKDLAKTLYVDFTKAPKPVTVAEKERHNENESLLAQFRAQMQAVREQRAEVTVTVTTELTPQEIREMRSYCDAVEDPNASRTIEAQLARCREFRQDYPESEYPLN